MLDNDYDPDEFDINPIDKETNEHRKRMLAQYSSRKTRDGSPLRQYIYCSYCKSETNHYCKSVHYRQYNKHDDREFWEMVSHRFWVCAGCENCTLEKVTINDSEGYSEFFPERSEYHITEKTFLSLPTKLDNLYRETLQAYNNGLSILCSAGLRALIEGICEDKKIKGKNLEEKINGLTEVLPSNIVTNLHNFRFIGNSALHELSAPKQEEIRIAIDICEDLLNFLYELDYKADRLSEMRKPKASSDNELPF